MTYGNDPEYEPEITSQPMQSETRSLGQERSAEQRLPVSTEPEKGWSNALNLSRSSYPIATGSNIRILVQQFRLEIGFVSCIVERVLESDHHVRTWTARYTKAF